MNHLAHALVAVRRGESVVGHLMGDFVKGAPEGRYEGAILHGIREHRRVDAYTDSHPVVARSFRRLAPGYRRYAGILTDIFYDHFLARRFGEFWNQSLREFADEVYVCLEAARPDLPQRMLPFVDHLRAADLLVSYRETGGVARALGWVSRRLRRTNPVASALEELERERAGLDRDFGEFFPDLLNRTPGKARGG